MCRLRSSKLSSKVLSGMLKHAYMLSRALPMDIVRIIGGHVCEHAAVMLQKWVRGAAVRFAWGEPRLCDMDGNLVYM